MQQFVEMETSEHQKVQREIARVVRRRVYGQLIIQIKVLPVTTERRIIEFEELFTYQPGKPIGGLEGVFPSEGVVVFPRDARGEVALRFLDDFRSMVRLNHELRRVIVHLSDGMIQKYDTAGPPPENG